MLMVIQIDQLLYRPKLINELDDGFEENNINEHPAPQAHAIFVQFHLLR